MSGESREKLWAKALGISTVLATVCSAISDFLKPILNSTLYLALAFLGLTVLVGLVQLLAGEKGREKLREIELMDIGKYWFGCLFSALMIFTIFLFVTYTFNSDDEDGFLAENIPFIGKLQEKWHMVEQNLTEINENTRRTAENTDEMKKDIKANVEQTKEIVEHTRATEEHSRTTADNTGQLVEQGKVQTELLKEVVNPADIRKQLAQKGYPFTIEGYSSQVKAGNLDILKLYYEAGWDSNIPGKDGFPPIFNAIIEQTPNFQQIVEQAITDGKFDINKKYTATGFSSLVMNAPMELCREIYGKSPMELSMRPPFSFDEFSKPISIGYLLAILYPFPDSNIYEFINNCHINMTDGIKFRKKFAENCLKEALAHNKLIQSLIDRNKQYIKSLAAQSPKDKQEVAKLFKAFGVTLPANQDNVFKESIEREKAQLINEKQLRQRLAEYRKGTDALANAVKSEN